MPVAAREAQGEVRYFGVAGWPGLAAAAAAVGNMKAEVAVEVYSVTAAIEPAEEEGRKHKVTCM